MYEKVRGKNWKSKWLLILFFSFLLAPLVVIMMVVIVVNGFVGGVYMALYYSSESATNIPHKLSNYYKGLHEPFL